MILIWKCLDVPHAPSSYSIRMCTLLELSLDVPVVRALILEHTSVLAWTILVAVAPVSVVALVNILVDSSAPPELFLFVAAQLENLTVLGAVVRTVGACACVAVLLFTLNLSQG